MKPLPTVVLKRNSLKGQDRIFVIFDYNAVLIERIKASRKFIWSASNRFWYINFSQENMELIERSFHGIAKVVRDHSIYKEPSQSTDTRKRTRLGKKEALTRSFTSYLKGKRYSESTVRTYCHLVADFLNYVSDIPFAELTNRDVERFIEEIYVPKNYSISTQRQFISALKLFVLFFPDTRIQNLELTRPKRSKFLPTVLSQAEVIDLLRCTKNLKHRAILAMIYSAGLRISELLNLRLKHIDIDRRQVIIKNGKGRKDRNVILAGSLIPLILNYLQTYMPMVYFAEGKPYKSYSAESVRAFLKRSCKAANISKHVTPHTLRHSYATHLLENGTDIRYIQELLGHAKPETTMLYTHVAKTDLMKIESPLDIALKSMLKGDTLGGGIRLSENY